MIMKMNIPNQNRDHVVVTWPLQGDDFQKIPERLSGYRAHIEHKMLFCCVSRSQRYDRRTERRELLPAGVRDCLGAIKFLSQGLVLPERLTFKGMPCRLWVSILRPDSSGRQLACGAPR